MGPVRRLGVWFALATAAVVAASPSVGAQTAPSGPSEPVEAPEVSAEADAVRAALAAGEPDPVRQLDPPSPVLAAVGAPFSDDFNRAFLQSGWSVTSSTGFAEVRTPGTELVVRVPPGIAHDLTATYDRLPRLQQRVANADFRAEVKYVNAPTAVGQQHGLLVWQDNGNWIRFQILFAPATGFASGVTQVGVVAKSGGVVRQPLTVVVPGGNVAALRVSRTGTQWRLEHSADGTSWKTAGTVSHSIAVRSLGPFAGTRTVSGFPAPQFISRLDYLFNSASPIVPEDPLADTAPLLIGTIVSTADDNRLQVTFDTDELAQGIVDIGTSPGVYTRSLPPTTLDMRHRAVVTNLQPARTYYLRIRATDTRGKSATSAQQVVRTRASGQRNTIVDVWYGDRQTSGAVGNPQSWVNLLGNVQDLDGIGSATWSLNGGAARPLTIGRDDRRLHGRPGDFNVDIPVAQLRAGANTVRLSFRDRTGVTTTRDVVIDHSTGRRWPLPYTADWSTTAGIGQLAQVVDGRWQKTAAGVRTSEQGYDRLIAIGDVTWTNYEVTAPITLHGFDPVGVNYPSFGSSLGFVLRFTGHVAWDTRQPAWGYYPLGSIGSYVRTSRGTEGLRLSDGKGNAVVAGPSTFRMAKGVPYIFRMRVETQPATGAHRYTLDVWRQGQPESSKVTLTHTEPASALARGSLLLLAHHVDATFGKVEVRPLP